ncbi:hypothetical protein HUU05_13840 [candidate division KSB1 bacterium]|nr:hypothetical protein [candidate division KSB1 bacterium]
METRRLLYKHFDSIRDELLQYHKHSSLAHHSDVKGSAREGFINAFLRNNLPSLVEYKTGEIIDCDDKTSGQIDIILQSALSPKIHLHNDIQITLSDFVLAAIEVKSNLTTASYSEKSHLKSALETFKKVKELKRAHFVTYHSKEKSEPIIHPNTPCFLIAYDGPSKETLHKHLKDFSASVYSYNYQKFWPEVISVIKQNYTIVVHDGLFVSPDPFFDFTYTHTDENEVNCLIPLFIYLCRVIESWNSQLHHTPFLDYFKELPTNKG